MSNRMEVLAKAIEALSETVNLSTGIAHPLDESRAKELLLALHGHKIPTPYDDVYRLAVEYGWEDRHAEDLAKLADRVNNGISVRVAYPRYWGEPTVEAILQDLGEES